jgi:hypothetical protein
LQLFPKKCRKKQQFSKKRARPVKPIRTGKNIFVCLKGADVKLQFRMKKILVILVALIGLGISANAQTSAQCKISGTDNATFSASISSFDYEKGQVVVSAQNDSGKTVTGTVSVRWGNTTKTITIIVARESESTPKTVTFSAKDAGDAKMNGWEPRISVTSARCN